MVMGRPITSQEGFQRKVLSGVFKDDEELQKNIELFAKEFAPRAKNRFVLGELKNKINYKAIQACKSQAFGPVETRICVKMNNGNL